MRQLGISMDEVFNVFQNATSEVFFLQKSKSVLIGFTIKENSFWWPIR
jgi:hypothetical protein